MNPPIPPPNIDPVCLIHQKRMSEHDCLYCCLCFKPLEVGECHLLPDGSRENVCEKCAAREAAALTKPQTPPA